MKQTTRSKITFIASFSNILLIIITLSSFTIFTRYLLEKNIEADIVTEAEEIIKEHLTIEDQRIVYVNSTSNLTLEQDLLTDRLSTKLFNKDNSTIGSFGIFARRELSTSENKLIRDTAKTSCTDLSRIVSTNITLAKQIYTILYYPLVQQGQLVSRRFLPVGGKNRNNNNKKEAIKCRSK